MSVGSKIRNYRCLFKMSQRELGIKAGFNEKTADVRIRQYEADRMVPKADKLKEIAEALGVPVEALTDHRIDRDSDFMRILFDMEDRFGLTVDKRGDEYVLVVKNDDFKWYKSNIQAELSAWYRERKKYDTAKHDKSAKLADVIKEYSIWKATYPKISDEQIGTFKKSLDEKFLQLKNEVTPFKPKTVAELIRHLELMAKAGIKMKICLFNSLMNYPMPAIQFSYNQLMTFEGEVAVLYAKFLTMVDYLSELRISVDCRMDLCENDMLVSHLLDSSKFSFVLTSLVPNMLRHAYNGTMDESPFREDYSTEIDRYAFETITEPKYSPNLSDEQYKEIVKKILKSFHNLSLNDDDIILSRYDE